MDLSPAWLVGWRCLHALAFALAPWALSPAPRAPDDANALMLRALAGLAGTGLLAALALRVVRRAPRAWPAWTGAVTLVVALGAALLLPRNTLPLGVSLWAVGPLAWATLAGALMRAAPASRRSAVAAAVAGCALATLAASLGRVASVDAMWWAAARARAPNPDAWHALVLRAGGDRDRQTEVLDRCAAVRPAVWTCALDRGRLALRERDFAAAAREADRALATRPDDPDALVLRALGLARQAPVAPTALEAGRRAVERSPRSSDAHLALALALDAAGRPAEAASHARTARSLGGGGGVMALQSLMALRTGDTAAARRSADEALRRSPEDPQALYTLGLVEQQAGHFNAAREAYLRSLAADRGGYAARYNLAVLTHGVGADDEARHHLEVLLRDHPEDPAATALLRQIDATPAAPSAALRTGGR